MVYENCKIYGPYISKDGRSRISVTFSNGFKCTVSYPKYLMECHLNRYLGKDETVDHIDCDFTNNALDNLQVLPRAEHARKDAVKALPLECVCACGRKFIAKNRRDVFNNRKKGKSGPYCSRTCAGRYSHRGPVSRIEGT